MRAFLEGVVAGYGIAIPVGPITLLIFDTAVKRGFAAALPASAGAASADLIYATAAALAGLALAEWLEPYAEPLRYIGAAVLLAIALYRSWELLRPAIASRRDPERSAIRTYAAFLGLTLTNPLTVTYFAALILGLQGATRLREAGPRFCSWQARSSPRYPGRSCWPGSARSSIEGSPSAPGWPPGSPATC